MNLQGQEEAGRRPGSTWRSPLLMVLLIGLALWLAWGYRSEVLYFFSDPEPLVLEGNVVPPGVDNAFVQTDGIPSRLQVTYEQLGTRYRVYYLLGSRLFVREPLPEDAESLLDPSGAYPTYSGRGRLLDLRSQPGYQGVRAFFETRGGMDFSERPAWLLLDGVEPGSQWQYPALVAVLLLIALVNAGLLVRRLFRR